MSDRFWRTLIRVVDVYDGDITVIVPGWHCFLDITVPRDEHPPFPVVMGGRYHAKVNIGADKGLHFFDWEPS